MIDLDGARKNIEERNKEIEEIRALSKSMKDTIKEIKLDMAEILKIAKSGIEAIKLQAKNELKQLEDK